MTQLWVEWKNGQITGGPKPLPKNIKSTSGFDLLPEERLNERGWYKFEETNSFDEVYYKSSGQVDALYAGVVKRTYTLKPIYTVGALKNVFKDRLKAIGKPLLRSAKSWIDYYAEFDDNNPKLALWQTYITELKTAYATIKAEVHPSITEYDELTRYIKCEPDPLVNGWRKHMPEQPEPE